MGTTRTLRRRGPFAAALGITSVLAGCACVPDDFFAFCGSTDTTVTALDPDDGAQRWSDEFDTREVRTALGGDVAVVASPNRVVRYDAQDGTKRWERDLPGEWAPSVVDDLVVVTSPDGRTVEALDSDDGSHKWRFGSTLGESTTHLQEDDCPSMSLGPGYDAVRATTLDAGSVLVVASEYGLRGVDRATGSVVWSVPQKLVVTPVLAEGVLVTMRDYGTAIGYDPADGTQLWVATLASDAMTDFVLLHRLGASSLLVADGVGVTVGFIERPSSEMLESPDLHSEESPDSTSAPSPTERPDVTSFVAALDARTGGLRWRIDAQVVPQVAADPTARTIAAEFALVNAENAVPVGIMVSDELVGAPGFFVTTDRRDLTLMDSATGEVRWVAELETVPVRVEVSADLILVETD